MNPPDENPPVVPSAPDPGSESETPFLTPQGPDCGPVMADVARWMRLALARNPFYILSAMLLLYSMRLLSGGSGMSVGETAQTTFNFSSFQVYELLLVFTGIFLARRMICYDAGLLIGVENLFVFVPFILISQALLISDRIATGLCLAGCLLAAGRAMSLKRWLPKANFPATLLVSCGLLLCLNVAVPVITRMLHRYVNAAIWDQRGLLLKGIEWQWLLPLLMAMAFALPARQVVASGQQEALYSRRYFPLLALSLWVAGTGAHLFCIDYVYRMTWENRLIVPVVWMGAWVLWQRRLDLDFVPEFLANSFEKILLTGPAAVLLLAVCCGWGSFFWLGTATAAIYVCYGFAKRQRLALHLACVSMTVAFVGLPHPLALTNVGNPHVVNHHLFLYPAELAAIIVGGYLILWTLLSIRPGMGIAGGIMLSSLVWVIPPAGEADYNLAINLGLVFAMLHSLRWVGNKWGHRSLALIWVGHCLFWTLMYPPGGGIVSLMSGFAVCVVYFCARGVMGYWAARVILWASVASMAMLPIRAGVLQVERAPVGLLIMAGSFVLFGIGTVAALNKKRWMPGSPLKNYG